MEGLTVSNPCVHHAALQRTYVAVHILQSRAVRFDHSMPRRNGSQVGCFIEKQGAEFVPLRGPGSFECRIPHFSIRIRSYDGQEDSSRFGATDPTCLSGFAT